MRKPFWMSWRRYLRYRLRILFCRHDWVKVWKLGTQNLCECSKCPLLKYEFWHIDGLDYRKKVASFQFSSRELWDLKVRPEKGTNPYQIVSKKT